MLPTTIITGYHADPLTVTIPSGSATSPIFYDEIGTLDKAEYWGVYVPALTGANLNLECMPISGSDWFDLFSSAGTSLALNAGGCTVVRPPAAYAYRLTAAAAQAAPRTIVITGQITPTAKVLS